MDGDAHWHGGTDVGAWNGRQPRAWDDGAAAGASRRRPGLATDAGVRAAVRCAAATPAAAWRLVVLLKAVDSVAPAHTCHGVCVHAHAQASLPPSSA